MMHNHGADSEACLNRQILSRRKQWRTCVKDRANWHTENYEASTNTVTYKDLRIISRNMHKARSSQLLPLPTDIEETHEALSAVQVLTSSTQLTC